MSELNFKKTGFISWMAKNPVTANLAMVFLLFGGFFSIFTVKQEVFPDFEIDTVRVSVSYPGASPEEVEKRKQKEEQKLQKQLEEEEFVCPDTVDEIDWDSWDPEERCVLTYVKNDNQVLLINKKQGIGRGLINGPGGHIELEETAIEAAYREFEEETGYTTDNLEYVGTLNFQFKDGLSMRGYVYIGEGAKGQLRDNEEATPFWCPIDALPLDQMWEDDKLWLEKALNGEKFVGNFIFDNEKMLSHNIIFE